MRVGEWVLAWVRERSELCLCSLAARRVGEGVLAWVRERSEPCLRSLAVRRVGGGGGGLAGVGEGRG